MRAGPDAKPTEEKEEKEESGGLVGGLKGP